MKTRAALVLTLVLAACGPAAVLDLGDAGPPAPCFEDAPCCDALGGYLPSGAPCGSGVVVCEGSGGLPVAAPACGGTSPYCDGPRVSLPRETASCLDGYQCPPGFSFCTWVRSF